MPQPSELLDGKRITRDNAILAGFILFLRRGQGGGSQTPIDAIMIFKDGVRPEWEDPLNASGGHFQAHLSAQLHRPSEVQLKPNVGGAQIDEYWNNIVLGMVGGTIDPYDMITGVRLVDKLSGAKALLDRRENRLDQAAGLLRIELWFSRPP